MTKPYSVPNNRKSEFPIDKIFLERWSPRSLSNENFTEEELLTLIEAARWTPSSSNVQPWRFLYAMHNTSEFKIFFELLGDFNKMWCKTAGALLVLISKKISDDGEPNNLYSFSAGSAFMSFALQARMENLVAHGMAGFDYGKAKLILKIPENYSVECMIAVGKQGNIEDLHERMQSSEKPNERKSLQEISARGIFPDDWN